MWKTTDLYNSRFYDLLPPNLRSPHTSALSAAYDRQMRKLLEYLPIVYILAMVERMDEAMCDTVARQFNIEEYDFSLTLLQKRELIRLMFQMGSKKGTNWIVDRLIETMLHSGESSEWFDFGGDPYLFRVTYDTEGNTEEDVEKFLRSLWTVKRESAWLERITRRSRVDQTVYVAALAETEAAQKYRLSPPEKVQANRPVHVAVIGQEHRVHHGAITPAEKVQADRPMHAAVIGQEHRIHHGAITPPHKACTRLLTYRASSCASYVRHSHMKGPVNYG